MPKETFFNLKNGKQERILRSAINEFNACGFTDANIGTIAKNAEVAKGSIYQYFKDKKELFVYCVTWSLGYILEKLEDQMKTAELDIFEYLAGDIKQGLMFIYEEKSLSLFTQDVFLGKFRLMPDDSIKEMMRVADEYILRLIRAGQENGKIRKDVDEVLLKLFLGGAAMKIKEHVLLEAGGSAFDLTEENIKKYGAVAEIMVDLLKNGIGLKGV